jgi:hypothetical protein
MLSGRVNSPGAQGLERQFNPPNGSDRNEVGTFPIL